MKTAKDVLEYLGFDCSQDADEEDPDCEWLGAKLLDVLGRVLVSQTTGGADWSARYVWGVPTALHDAAIPGSPLTSSDEELFLVWDEGDLYEPLLFMKRRHDRKRDEYVLEEAGELTGPIVHQMELARPSHVRPSQAPRHRR